MSILACLIGILTLMISVTMQVNEQKSKGLTEEETSRALRNRDVKKEIKKVTEEITSLDKEIETHKSTSAEMRKLKDRQIVLRDELKEIAKASDKSKTDAELQKLAENLKREIAALKQEQPSLAKRIEELKKLIAERKIPPKADEKVVVRPGGIGSRTARNVFFVECNSTGITIIEKGRKPVTVSQAAIDTNKNYSSFLQRVKSTDDSMILFLIRKSGNTSYLWAAGWAESQFKLRTGKLPVPKDGPIDLSAFD